MHYFIRLGFLFLSFGDETRKSKEKRKEKKMGKNMVLGHFGLFLEKVKSLKIEGKVFLVLIEIIAF